MPRLRPATARRAAPRSPPLSSANPISERLDQLHDEWVWFARNDQARLLIWRVASDERAMVDTFIGDECNGETAHTPDLFIQLTPGFSKEAGHGYVLATALYEQYSQAAEGLEEPAEQRWRPPRAKEGEDDVQFLLRVLGSLRSHQLGPESDARLALWLDPTEVRALKPYLRWLQRLVQRAPSELRFLLLVGVAETVFQPLLQAEPERVVARACALDMPGAIAELARRGDNGEPGGKFRILQTELGAAIEAGDLAACQPIAKAALEIARAAGWLELAAVVHMMLATALVMHGRPLEALKSYGEAGQLGVAREAKEAESPDAPKLGGKIRLQARLGQGAILLAQRAFKQAADVYLDAAAIAKSLADARSELDGYRLASICRSEQGDARFAWEIGMRGFQLGLAMDDETRRTSTLPYLADHLLRMTHRHEEYAAHARPLEQQLGKLLGPDWRSQLAQAEAA